MIRILAAVALVWLALLPPFFTEGACSAEFDKVSSQLSTDQRLLSSPTEAKAYWDAHSVPSSVVSEDQCRRAKPRFIDVCPRGTLIYVSVPVKNTICRIYRDASVRVQLHYDESGQLRRTITEMNPFKSLPLTGFHITLHWAR